MKVQSHRPVYPEEGSNHLTKSDNTEHGMDRILSIGGCPCDGLQRHFAQRWVRLVARHVIEGAPVVAVYNDAIFARVAIRLQTSILILRE